MGAIFNNTQDCGSCNKYSVCKYSVERMKLYDMLKEVCDSKEYNSKSGMFIVSMGCKFFGGTVNSILRREV